MISKTTFTAIVFYFVYSGICEAEGGVSIYGELVNYNDTTIINITCTSDFASSTAEFIINEISEDQVRFHNGRCYHRNNECKPTACSCSPNHFTLLHRVTVKSDLEAACKMRFINQDESKELKTTASLLFNGIEFFTLENPPEVLPNDEPNKQDGNEARRTSVAIEVSVLICVGIVILLSSICFIYRCLKKPQSPIIDKLKGERGKGRCQEKELDSLCGGERGKERCEEKELDSLCGGERGKGQDEEKELDSFCGDLSIVENPLKILPNEEVNSNDRNEAQSPIIGKPKEIQDKDIGNSCDVCTMPFVCAICTDCKQMFCDICCGVHSRSKQNHAVCEIEYVVTCNLHMKCTKCKKKNAEKVCMKCIKGYCIACCKHHTDNKNEDHVIRHLVMKKRRDGGRIIKDAAPSPQVQLKYKIKTKREPDTPSPKICGVCFIADGRIVISEYHHKTLLIYEIESLRITHKLGQEPKGMTNIKDNSVAITYPFEKQIKLYKINDSSVNEVHTFQLPDKPFSIAYNYPNFAVEMGVGDDGVIVILNETGEIKHTIRNETSFAYFTSNTIRLALDSENRKVFVTAMSKTSVSCVNYAGNVLWRASVPSPRGLVFVGNLSHEQNMIIASKQFNMIFTMNSANGQNDIIMSAGPIQGPIYIDYNLDEHLLCIQVDNGDILVFQYDITAILNH